MAEVLPEAVYTAAQVREIDRIAIERLGIAGARLMQRAAEAALARIDARWPDAGIAVYCGAGNNAGDGYVLARLAAERGRPARVVAVVAPDSLKGDAARAYRDCASAGVVIDRPDAAAFDVPGDAGLVVDALLGTGLDRPLDGPLAAAVAAINASRRPVVALDVPTGIGADTGAVYGTAVQADLTVTFVGLKQGLFLGDAPNYLGTLEFSDLRIPPEASAGMLPVMRRLSRREFHGVLRPRPRTAHKGAHGRLLMIGGGPGMGGAIRLAAEAGARVGAGLIHVATHPDNVATVMVGRPELICRGCDAGGIPADWVTAADAIVIGPGLGQGAWGRAALRQVRGCTQPVVADADGLNLLAAGPFERVGDWILTPHPGEAARLLGVQPAAIQRDRLDSVRQLAARFDATVVLKGAGTLVATAARPGDVAVCDHGNPGMATAGMGDVLAGVIGALCAQGADSATAARAGVLLHALAGDAAAAAGERGMLAADLFPELRRLANPA